MWIKKKVIYLNVGAAEKNGLRDPERVSKHFCPVRALTMSYYHAPIPPIALPIDQVPCGPASARFASSCVAPLPSRSPSSHFCLETRRVSKLVRNRISRSHARGPYGGPRLAPRWGREPVPPGEAWRDRPIASFASMYRDQRRCRRHFPTFLPPRFSPPPTTSKHRSAIAVSTSRRR